MTLDQYDIDILRMLDGQDVPGLRWGAAMSVAVESLVGRGLVTRGPTHTITEAGRAALANHKGETDE